MNRHGIVLAGVLLAMAASAAPAPTDAASFEGDWFAPAEDADDVDALIHLAPKDARWEGTIQSILSTRPGQAYRNETPCAACPGPLRGHAMQGLPVMWGFQAQGGRLVGGHVLDPGDGQVYDGEVTISADGRTLKVLAYKGLKFIGHVMTWRRA